MIGNLTEEKAIEVYTECMRRVSAGAYDELEPDGTITIALTLLRCVEWLSRDDLSTRRGHAGPGMHTPGAQMQGRWKFQYSLIPHEGAWENAYTHAHQFVHGRRQGVRANRRQVLIRERVTDQRVVGRVGSPRERAKGRRDAADLDVDVARDPRANPEVDAVRFGPLTVFAANLGQQRHVTTCLHRGRQRRADHP